MIDIVTAYQNPNTGDYIIPAGIVTCPSCDGIGGDVDHVGDSQDAHGGYKAIYAYGDACGYCGGSGLVKADKADAYNPDAN